MTNFTNPYEIDNSVNKLKLKYAGYINPLQGYKHIDNNPWGIYRGLSVEHIGLRQSDPPFVSKKGKTFPTFVQHILLEKEFKRLAKKAFYKEKENYLNNKLDPDYINVYGNRAIYGSFFNKKQILKDDLLDSSLKFIAEKPYRAYIAECNNIGDPNEDTVTIINKIEDKNSYFLNQVKYVPNPNILGLLYHVPDISPAAPKSQVIMMHYANYYNCGLDEATSLTEQDFFKIKKELEKKNREKYDFRKSSNIKRFYNAFCNHRKITANIEDEFDAIWGASPLIPMPAMTKNKTP